MRGASVKLEGILSKQISSLLPKQIRIWMNIPNKFSQAQQRMTKCPKQEIWQLMPRLLLRVAHAERTELLQHPAWCIGICCSCLVNAWNSGTGLPGVFLKFLKLHTFHTSSHHFTSPTRFKWKLLSLGSFGSGLPLWTASRLHEAGGSKCRCKKQHMLHLYSPLHSLIIWYKYLQIPSNVVYKMLVS